MWGFNLSNIFMSSCLKSYHDPEIPWLHTSSRNLAFPQEKNSESLQDPYWICQGSSTERPKILPSGYCQLYMNKFERITIIDREGFTLHSFHH
jgi:hypothetical protein